MPSDVTSFSTPAFELSDLLRRHARTGVHVAVDFDLVCICFLLSLSETAHQLDSLAIAIEPELILDLPLSLYCGCCTVTALLVVFELCSRVWLTRTVGECL